jgi:serine/threonine protein phosphatase PrpC
MDVAIRGDLASCLTLRLAPATWLFAVARGFGAVDGVPIARAALARLEGECRRRSRGEARRQRFARSPAAASMLCGALARVNGALYLRSAGHDDYVPAACSLSAVLVVRNRAYVAHAGSTAVYLVHGAGVFALTAGDAFEDASQPVLSRALGIAPSLTFAVSSIALECGDVLALCGHSVPGASEAAQFVRALESGTEEQVLRVRYEPSDDATPARSTTGIFDALAARLRAIFH